MPVHDRTLQSTLYLLYKNSSFLVSQIKMADAVRALPFTTEFQVKPGWTGL